MIRSTLAVVVLGFTLVTGPLLGQGIPEPARSTDLSDVVLPPQLDRVLRVYERAWRAGDAAALASLFAEDGFVLQNNRPPIRGRTAIRAAYEAHGGAPLRLRALAFAAEGSVGYIIGAYGYGSTPGDTGKFTLTLRRSPGGQWLILSDMDSANAPPQHRNAPAAPTQAGPPAAH